MYELTCSTSAAVNELGKIENILKNVFADPCSSNPCQRGSCTSSNGDFECHCPSGYSGKTCGPLPMDCKDIINRPHLFSNRGDGVYTIMLPRSHTVLRVFCNMTHDSGGWTAFQRRVTNSPDFHRNLAEYKKGFGDINSNFWMGLENLKEIVDLGPTDGKLHGVVVGANDSSLHEQCTYTMRIISLNGAPSFTIETEANTNFSCTGSIVPEANGQVDIDDVSPHVATFATYDRDTTDRCATHQGGGCLIIHTPTLSTNSTRKRFSTSTANRLATSSPPSELYSPPERPRRFQNSILHPNVLAAF
ncbi:ficolin-2-like [Mya arenaria]|uniref:ficolin-2-like n=1 Tax=Mya arenaria TaxID=6604 RepID=UPI0022E1657D|nr:ficolin-2-like [Mya arenaria]